MITPLTNRGLAIDRLLVKIHTHRIEIRFHGFTPEIICHVVYRCHPKYYCIVNQKIYASKMLLAFSSESQIRFGISYVHLPYRKSLSTNVYGVSQFCNRQIIVISRSYRSATLKKYSAVASPMAPLAPVSTKTFPRKS